MQQQWEYCHVDVGDRSYACFYKPTELRRVAITQDKSKGDQDTRDAVSRFIAGLGLDGWELVSVGMDRRYFKRPA
jgi:hypothetical protein